MRIAIVGAGLAGLAAARTLRDVGHDVIVFESSREVGGVWSASRRYPGVSLQNDKRTYAYSDLAMGEEVNEYPRGAEVGEYFRQFVQVNRLDPLIRLDTRVLSADQETDGSWNLEVRGPDGLELCSADFLVMANGLTSTVHVPRWPGRAEYESAGGRVLAPSELGDGEELDDRSTLVVGWGKSGTDIAAAIRARGARTTILARSFAWKLPKHIGRIRFQTILLSRGGEHFMWGPSRSFAGTVLRKLDDPIRQLLVRRLGRTLEKQLRMRERGILPLSSPNTFECLVSDGLLEGIDDGSITVRADVGVARLGAGAGGPEVVLTDGSIMQVDRLVAATGFEQDVTMFPAPIRERLVDSDHEVHLYRRILPLRVDRLAFIGWSISFRSPVTAEVQAAWLAAHLAGALARPVQHARPRAVQVFRLSHESAEGRHAPQLPLPTSIIDFDDYLDDLGYRPPVGTRAAEWFRPLDPSAYRTLLPWLTARLLPASPAAGERELVRRR